MNRVAALVGRRLATRRQIIRAVEQAHRRGGMTTGGDAVVLGSEGSRRDRPAGSTRRAFPNALAELTGMTRAATGSHLDHTIARITKPTTDKPATGHIRCGGGTEIIAGRSTFRAGFILLGIDPARYDDMFAEARTTAWGRISCAWWPVGRRRRSVAAWSRPRCRAQQS